MSAAVTTGAAPAGAQRGRPATTRRLVTRPVLWLVILVILALTLVPMLYVIIGGFRSTAQLNNDPAGLPHPWVWSNYGSVLTSATFWHAVASSAVIAVVATTTAVTLGSMAAFALSRYQFRGREGIYLLFIMGLLFPANAAVLPLFLLLQQIGLLDSLFGVALPEAAFQLPITILILRPFMRAIPGELEDAAVVDGAGRFGFFLRILVPLSRPALTTVGILAFVVSWNAYLLPLVVFTSQSKYPLPLAVATFQSTYTQNTAAVFAFTALSMLPALALFVFAQRKLVGALSGALKG
jgi:raffinose/stachyose/melibiose transport system permease protein